MTPIGVVRQYQTLVQEERLRRLKGEAITSGSKNGKAFSISRMTEAELSGLESAIAARLGGRRNYRRRISFNGRC